MPSSAKATDVMPPWWAFGSASLRAVAARLPDCKPLPTDRLLPAPPLPPRPCCSAARMSYTLAVVSRATPGTSDGLEGAAELAAPRANV